MIETDATGPSRPPGGQPSLFDSAGFPAEAYCEAFLSPGDPREQWRPIMASLDSIGFDGMQQRQDRTRRMRHEDGATYNPFDDPAGQGIPWALEIIPQPITAVEWLQLEAGLIQRAVLLERILADAYGPQNLIKNNHLPPALLYANPNFLHPCHGVPPSGGRYLTYYAADLYRGPDGRFRVLRDYTANPVGLGYALENRIVISRIFAGMYHKTQTRRLAPFFHTFHLNLAKRIAESRENPDVVLLSPGPDSLIYFEHAILSRYLGYPLVEGQDLTVRNGKVFLKKLAGLESVEAVFRHIPDQSMDPLALRKESIHGVAGLIQVCREDNLAVINPIGSGLAETPALAPFLPALCQVLMGEDLLLESHPAWWCGNAEGLRYTLDHLEQLAIGPAMNLSSEAPSDPAAAVKTDPQGCLAREAMLPGVVPVWTQAGITSCPTLLRVFACAIDQGFAVMPGGLAITAPDREILTGPDPHLQQSKDVWVMSDQPVQPFSLMAGLETVAEVNRGGDLPSRVADHLLWLGRYLERAEGLVRLLRAVIRRLSGEARPGDIPELPFLLNLLRSRQVIPQPAKDGVGIPPYRELSSQLHGALYRSDRMEGVAHTLKRVRETARNARDRLSPDAWRAINRLERMAYHPAGDPLEDLNDILFTLSAFSGLAMESMTRGLGWRFMDMGRRVERAMNQSRLILSGLDHHLCSEQRGALEALLEVSDSIMTYRARYRAAFQLSPVMDLLVVDETNPKSLAFQLGQLAAHVEHLPRQDARRYASAEERTALQMLTSVRLLDVSGLGQEESNCNDRELAGFLKSTEQQLKRFSQQISAHYLSRVPTTPHYALQQETPPR